MENKIMKLRFLCGYQNTKTNGEDFALTPYIFIVNAIKVKGLGICFGHHSIYIGFGFNIPKNYPTFTVLK